MKTKKYTLKVAIMAMLISMFSCDDNKFLEEDPSTFYTIDNIFSSSEQVDQVLISIYSYMRDLWVNPNNADWISNFKGKGTDIYDTGSIRKGNTFSDYSVINPNHNTFKEVYAAWYYIISRANLAIYASELPQVSWASEQNKAYVLAQARFFRAFAYKNLAELFGGVPIVTDIVTAPHYDYSRTTRIETYQFAIDEMEDVLKDFPEITSSGGRLVQGAVLHNLCELYLAIGIQMKEEGKESEAQNAFTTSISYGDQVIDKGNYSLMTSRFGTRKSEESFSIDVHKNGNFTSEVVDTINFETNHYWDLFQEGNVNYQDGNKECIWAIQIDYDAYKAEDNKSKLGYTRAFCPILRDVAPEWFTGMLEDLGGRGVCIVIPTMYARDEIYSDKFKNDIRNSETVFRRRFKGNVSTSPYYKKILPLDVIYHKASDEQTNFNNRSMVFPISCKITTDKFTGLEDGENRSNLFRDDYFIRLSETILLRAEAKQRKGDKAGAAADINLLRDRAKCGYKVTAFDMDDNFNMILDERARELIYEECRWNTLLRMGGTIAVDRIRKYAYWPETAATLTFNYNLWPIPQSVIDTNKDVVLPQNKGWTNR